MPHAQHSGPRGDPGRRRPAPVPGAPPLARAGRGGCGAAPEAPLECHNTCFYRRLRGGSIGGLRGRARRREVGLGEGHFGGRRGLGAQIVCPDKGGRQVRAHGRVGAVALAGAVFEAVHRGAQVEYFAFRAHLTREPTEPRGSVRRRCADDSGRLAVARSPMAARKDAPRYSPNRVIGAKKWSDGGTCLVSRIMVFGATVPTTYPEKPGIRGPEPVRRRPPRTSNVRGGPTRFRRRPGRFACGLFEAT